MRSLSRIWFGFSCHSVSTGLNSLATIFIILWENDFELIHKESQLNAKYLLVFACVAMVFLSFAVAVRMFLIRVAEMKEKRLHPQAIADSNQSAAALQVVKASDNYRNLFEMPVLFSTSRSDILRSIRNLRKIVPNVSVWGGSFCFIEKD